MSGRRSSPSGVQDVDVAGLTPPAGVTILGASSDHLVVDTGATPVAVGAEVRFQVDYSALLRAMTSPFVAKVPLAASGPGRGPAVGLATTLRR